MFSVLKYKFLNVKVYITSVLEVYISVMRLWTRTFNLFVFLIINVTLESGEIQMFIIGRGIQNNVCAWTINKASAAIFDLSFKMCGYYAWWKPMNSQNSGVVRTEKYLWLLPGFTGTKTSVRILSLSIFNGMEWILKDGKLIFHFYLN